MRVRGRRVCPVQLVDALCNVASNRVLVFRTQNHARLVQVLEQRDLLRLEDVHHASLPVEAHAFNWQQVLVVHLLQDGSLFEYLLDHLRLHSLEVDHTCQQRVGQPRIVQRLYLVERAEWPRLLALVELLVKGELAHFGEHTVWEDE